MPVTRQTYICIFQMWWRVGINGFDVIFIISRDLYDVYFAFLQVTHPLHSEG